MLNVVSVVGNRFDPRNDAQNGHIEFAGEFFIIAQTGIRSVDDNDGNTGDDKGKPMMRPNLIISLMVCPSFKSSEGRKLSCVHVVVFPSMSFMTLSM